MSKNSNNNGIGVVGLLGVSFVVLKLTGHIDWSWWYVTLPFWGGVPLVVVSVVLAFLVPFLKGKVKKVMFSYKENSN